MDLFTPRNISFVGVPMLGVGIGALGGWLVTETICGTLNRNKWLSPVLGALVGIGGGVLITFLISK